MWASWNFLKQQKACGAARHTWPGQALRRGCTLAGHLNGHVWEIKWKAYALRWWHSWMFLATVSSWTTELVFWSWNVPKQNSIKWRLQPDNWELLQRLKHQGFRSFSPTLREFQIRELVCQSCGRKKKGSKEATRGFVCGLQCKEQTCTKECAGSRRYTLDWAKFSRGNRESELKCKASSWKQGKQQSPLSRTQQASCLSISGR